jgi:hypothetical protein
MIGRNHKTGMDELKTAALAVLAAEAAVAATIGLILALM